MAEANRFPGQGLLEGAGILAATLMGIGAAAAEADHRSERRRLHEELEREERRAKEKVIERMASNFPSTFETRETLTTRYLVEELNRVNQQLRTETSWVRKSMLEERRNELEDKLGL
jgi:hypothetical protein